MGYVIGIDVGTSGTKTVLVNKNGDVVASSTHNYELFQPQNGWAEQDPNHWFEAACNSIRDVIKSSKIDASEIDGVGLTGQMHGLVMLDENFNVIRNAILWCDQRTKKQCEDINKLVGESRHIEIAANPPLTGFTSPKILWVRENEPENYKKCVKILLPKDYIRFKLTGTFYSDVSDASGMGLLDVKNRIWSKEILEKLEIKEEMLAKVCESIDITGYITEEAQNLTGLKAGTLVSGGAGDNAAAAVGTGVVSDGRAFTTIGSSGVVFAHTKNPIIEPEGRIHTFCAAVPNEWHVMGVTQGAGLSLKWLKETVCTSEILEAKEKDVDVYDLMMEEAKEAPIGSDKLLFLPYLMGERTPHLNPNARGVFFGLSNAHERKHLTRSVVEGVSFSLLDCVNLLKNMGINCDDMALCGGGGKSDFWREMLSDIFNCEVKILENSEGPAYGAAILAAVSAKWFDSVAEGCDKFIKVKSSQKPSKENNIEYLKFYQIFKKLYTSLKPLYEFEDLNV